MDDPGRKYRLLGGNESLEVSKVIITTSSVDVIRKGGEIINQLASLSPGTVKVIEVHWSTRFILRLGQG